MIKNITQLYYDIDHPKIFRLEKNTEFYFDAFNIFSYFNKSKENVNNKGNNLLVMWYRLDNLDNNIKIYSFYLKKEFEYRTVIFIPEK